MKNLSTLLQDYGLSATESHIYLKMLEIGPSSVLEIARKAGLNRSTTHVNVEDLIEKGLATQIMKGLKRLIIPEPPEKLSITLENEKFKMKRKEENLNLVVNTIYDSIASVKENTSSEVKYYKDKKSIARVYDEILESKEIRAYVNANEIWKVFPENKEKFSKASKNNQFLWDLMQYNSADKEFYEGYNYSNYKFKFLPEHIHINAMDYLITDYQISIVQGIKDPTCIVIKNKHLAENSKVIFDLLWSFI